MSKRAKKKGGKAKESDAPLPEPLCLWEPRKEIRETTKEIDRLTKLVFPVNGQTNYLVGTTLDSDPFAGMDSGLVYASQIAKNQHLYNTRDSGRWGILDHVKHLEIRGVSWMCRVNPPDWARDLSVDMVIHLANLLPIDKVFILAGLCKRFRTICFGAPPKGTRGRLVGGKIIWDKYLERLAFHQVPPRCPASMEPFFEARKLAPTHLSKWGFPMEKSMRKKGERAAVWPAALPCKGADGVIYYPELKEDPNLNQMIRVMIGDDAFCLLVRATSSTKPENVECSIRQVHKVAGAAIFKFFVQCPPPEVLKTFSDQQFTQIGLWLPSRDPETQVITSLPLRDEFIPWLPRTPLALYCAKIGWKVRAKIYERRSFRFENNEALRKLIIQRFKSNKFCKHCYKEIVTHDKGPGRLVPLEWLELVPNIAPICTECFTHRFSSELVSIRFYEEALQCPKCSRILRRYERRRPSCDRVFELCYGCLQCEVPVLQVMYIKQQLRFQPHMTNWIRQCTGLDPADTELMKKSKDAKRERYITDLKLSIKSGLATIMSQQAILDDLGVHDYPKVQMIEEEVPPPPIQEEERQSLKRSATAIAGKAPPPLKKPMMSPASLRVSGKKPMSITHYGDDDDAWDLADEECWDGNEDEIDGYSW